MKKKTNKKKISYLPIVSLLILFSIIGIAFALFPETDLVIHYYDFNETTGDLIDKVNGLSNGTLVNSVGYTIARGNDIPGILNNAYNFSAASGGGAGSYINFTNPDSSCYDLNCSLSIWINWTEAGARVIYFQGNASVTSGAYLDLVSNGGAFNVNLKNNTGQTASIDTSSTGYNNGMWQHVVIVMNRTSLLLYTNGTLIGQRALNSTSFIIERSIEYIATRPTSNAAPADFFQGRVDEMGLWNTSLSASQVLDLYNNGSGLNIVGLDINLLSPQTNALIVNLSQTFETDYSSNFLKGADLQNITFYIWLNNGTLFNKTTEFVSGEFNSSNLTINNFNPESYKWNVEACANTTSGLNHCNFADTNLTFTIGSLNTSTVFNSTIYETAIEFFREFISIPSGSTISSSKFIFNGTSYSATVAQVSGNNYTLSRSLDVPLYKGGVAIQQNFTWNVTYSTGFEQEISKHQLTYDRINLTLCTTSPQNVPYLNYTFKNETTSQQSVSSSINSGTFLHYLGTGSINKTLTYSNPGELLSYAYCFYPPHLKVNLDIDLTYQNSYSEQRSYSSGLIRQGNGTLNTTLFLLPTSEGIFVTFQVLNLANQPIQGALVTLQDSSGNIISQTTTGASGTTTVFLNPDSTYTLTVSKAGFDSFVATQTFPTSEFTIKLGGTLENAQDFTKGISTIVLPQTGILFNNTNYNFNYTIESTFWNLEGFGFYLYNDTGDIFARQTSTVDIGGFLSSTNNTANYKRITMNYYWLINGTYSNATVSWIIKPDKEGSIQGFFARLIHYLNGGLLGIKAEDSGFVLGLIIFSVTFITVGILTFKFGIVHEVTVSGLAFAFMGLFDAGLGLLPMRGVATAFAGLIFVAFALREVQR